MGPIRMHVCVNVCVYVLTAPVTGAGSRVTSPSCLSVRTREPPMTRVTRKSSSSSSSSPRESLACERLALRSAKYQMRRVLRLHQDVDHRSPPRSLALANVNATSAV